MNNTKTKTIKYAQYEELFQIGRAVFTGIPNQIKIDGVLYKFKLIGKYGDMIKLEEIN